MNDLKKRELIIEYRKLLSKREYTDQVINRMREIEGLVGYSSEDMERIAIDDYGKQY